MSLSHNNDNKNRYIISSQPFLKVTKSSWKTTHSLKKRFFQRTQVQFSAPMSDSSKLPVMPAPGHTTLSSSLLEYPTSKAYVHTNTHINKNKPLKVSKFKCTNKKFSKFFKTNPDYFHKKKTVMEETSSPTLSSIFSREMKSFLKECGVRVSHSSPKFSLFLQLPKKDVTLNTLILSSVEVVLQHIMYVIPLNNKRQILFW